MGLIHTALLPSEEFLILLKSPITEHWWAESPFRKGVMGHGSALPEVWPENYAKALCFPEIADQRDRRWQGGAPVFVFVPYRPFEDFKGSKLTIFRASSADTKSKSFWIKFLLPGIHHRPLARQTIGRLKASELKLL